MRVVRVASTLALLALASFLSGCTQADPGSGGTGGGFAPSCPSWQKLGHTPHSARGDALIWSETTTPPQYDVEAWDFAEPTANRTTGAPVPGTPYGSGNLEHDGLPLDFLRFPFQFKGNVSSSSSYLIVFDAEVHLEFIAAEDGYPTGEVLPSFDVRKGAAHKLDKQVFRSHPATGYAIHNVTLQVDLAAPDEDANPRGVFVHWTWVPDLDGDPDTPSVLRRAGGPELWYRTCGKD